MQISLNNCGKSYNKQWLFRDLNCTFNIGEKWAFLGANGSGKSTLALMIAAQVWPTEGEIFWELNQKKAEAQKVFSYVSLASPGMELPEEFTFNEVVTMHEKIKPFSANNSLKKMADLCKFDLKTCNKTLANYSSGMKQRVKLCLAAFSDTPVLILDEPLSNLDEAGFELFDYIIENYTKNRLLIVASNSPAEFKSCTNFLRLNPDGLVVIN